MANYQKYPQHALGHMFKHFKRENGKDGKPIQYSNQSIDLSKSHLNYNLAPDRGNLYAFVKKRCSEVYCLNRSDVNLMGTWCFTMPKDAKQEEYKAVFQAAYDFMAERYGKENVISAYVHMDETTPHMHFAFVPVAYDKKKERFTVSSKLVVNQTELKRFHPELEKAIEKRIGRKLQVLTGELSDRPNLSLEQYRSLKAAEEKSKELNEKLRVTTAEYESKAAYIDILAASQDAIYDGVKEKKDFHGNTKSVEIADDKFREIRQCYAAMQATKQMRQTAETMITELNGGTSPTEVRALKAENERQREHIESLTESIQRERDNTYTYEMFLRANEDIGRRYRSFQKEKGEIHRPTAKEILDSLY